MEIIQRLLLGSAILAALGAYGIYRSDDKDAKKSALLCLGLSIILGIAGFNYTDDDTKSQSNTYSHGEYIPFNGHLNEYKYEYSLPAYDGNGNYMCDVEMKSSNGKLYAFPNKTSRPVNYWNAPYNAPNACTYSCAWGGGYIYF